MIGYFVITLLAASIVLAIVLYFRHRQKQVMDGLSDMVEAAINGTFSETTFDESRQSSLENRLAQYLTASELSVRNIDAETLQLFMSYDWPGNVRELQHCIEHAMNVLPDSLSTITAAYIPAHIRGGQPQKEVARESVHATPEFGSMLRGMERQGVENALRQTGGNISQAAKLLGLSRQNLQYRIRRYQLDPADYTKA